VRTAELNVQEIYTRRTRTFGAFVAVIRAEQWVLRQPYAYNEDQRAMLVRGDVEDVRATVGWHDDGAARGVPVLRSSVIGFGDTEARDLVAMAAAARLAMGDRDAVRVSDIVEALRFEFDDQGRRVDLVVERPQILDPTYGRFTMREPEPVPESYPGASILAVVWLDGEPAQTVQDVQQAWRRCAPGPTGPTEPLSWGQVTLAGGGRDEHDQRVWAIRGLDADVVRKVRARREGRFSVGTLTDSVHETEDSASHGWEGSEHA
jgi:hypothetical protein